MMNDVFGSIDAYLRLAFNTIHRQVMSVLGCLVLLGAPTLSVAQSQPHIVPHVNASDAKPLRTSPNIGPIINPDLKRADGERPKVGLVLGGGGAKGLAHVGVLRVLEEYNIKVDYVAGTSIGAVVGALYASGYNAKELETIASDLNWQELFTDAPSRGEDSFRRKAEDFSVLTDFRITFENGKLRLPQGFIQGQELYLELARLLAPIRQYEKFDDFPIPFRAVAMDVENGEQKVFETGDVVSAIFASMAIPGFIPPIERNGRSYIDGGFVNNIPISVVRNMGADIVIAVDVGDGPKPIEELRSILDVLRQTQILLTRENSVRQKSLLRDQDILIEPGSKNFSFTSFSEAEALIKDGRSAAEAQAENLAIMAARLNAYSPNGIDLTSEHKHPKFVNGQPVLSAIRIEQDSNLSDRVIRKALSAKVGEPIDFTRLNADIKQLYADGVFKRVTYEIEQTPDSREHILVVKADVSNSRNGYFRVGLGIDSNLDDESDLRLGISYTKPQINTLGAELRATLIAGDEFLLEADFFQPLNLSQDFFIEPKISISREEDVFFDNKGVVRGLLTRRLISGMAQGGMSIGRFAEIRGGYGYANGSVDLSNAATGPAKFDVEDGFIFGQWSFDTIDSLAFPRHGTYARFRYERHDDKFGGDFNFNAYEAEIYKPVTFGQNTVDFRAEIMGADNTSINLIGPPEIGGLLHLSGFRNDEVSGPVIGFAGMTYKRRLNSESAILDMPVFLGASVEMGNTFPSFEAFTLSNPIWAGSVFGGIESPIGPVFVGLGYNDTGRTAVYFKIGNRFD